ncbi:MAG: glycosyltransferase family 9 protein [Opitutae bacterium]|nr:glycosyltransferase family 9 protein [Opitutae bacterium]
MPFPDPRPQRILVIRYRFIGDTVLAVPALRNLRQAFPQARIDVLAEPVSGDTLAFCPYKDELLFYAPRLKGERKRQAKFPTSLLGAARFLRERKYDRCYILRRSFSSAILPLLAGIPHRVGFATDGRAWLLQRHTPYADKHEVECFLDVLRADDIPVTDTRNENWTDPHRSASPRCWRGSSVTGTARSISATRPATPPTAPESSLASRLSCAAIATTGARSSASARQAR